MDAKKDALKAEIYQAGKSLEAQVKLLLSIRGITPLLALAFLSEVGDIRRFRSARKPHSYLGVVPTVRSSGGVTNNGTINRRSRHLSRTLFTQAVNHFVDSSSALNRFYRELVDRKGCGRARIAVLRKVFFDDATDATDGREVSLDGIETLRKKAQRLREENKEERRPRGEKTKRWLVLRSGRSLHID